MNDTLLVRCGIAMVLAMLWAAPWHRWATRRRSRFLAVAAFSLLVAISNKVCEMIAARFGFGGYPSWGVADLLELIAVAVGAGVLASVLLGRRAAVATPTPSRAPDPTR